MQAAFLLVFLFPPPAAGAFRFTGLDGARTGRAADGEKAAVMQHVVGNVFGVNEGDVVVARPVEQRIDLDELARAVDFSERRLLTLRRPIAAQAGDPCACAFQRAPERHDLAHAAAMLRRRASPG